MTKKLDLRLLSQLEILDTTFQVTGHLAEQGILLEGGLGSGLDLGIIRFSNPQAFVCTIPGDSRHGAGLESSVTLLGSLDGHASLAYDEGQYSGVVSTPHIIAGVEKPSIAFAWSKKDGLRITKWPMVCVTDALPFEKLVKLAKGSGCEQLANQAVKNLITTHFNISARSKGKVGLSSLGFVLSGTYTVQVLGKDLFDVSMPELELVIEAPQSCTPEDLVGALLKAIVDNGATIIADLLANHPAETAKLTGAIGLTTLTSKAAGRAFCELLQKLLDQGLKSLTDAAAAAASQVAQTAEGAAGVAAMAPLLAGADSDKKGSDLQKQIDDRRAETKAAVRAQLAISEEGRSLAYQPEHQLTAAWKPIGGDGITYRFTLTGPTGPVSTQTTAQTSISIRHDSIVPGATFHAQVVAHLGEEYSGPPLIFPAYTIPVTKLPDPTGISLAYDSARAQFAVGWDRYTAAGVSSFAVELITPDGHVAAAATAPTTATSVVLPLTTSKGGGGIYQARVQAKALPGYLDSDYSESPSVSAKLPAPAGASLSWDQENRSFRVTWEPYTAAGAQSLLVAIFTGDSNQEPAATASANIGSTAQLLPYGALMPPPGTTFYARVTAQGGPALIDSDPAPASGTVTLLDLPATVSQFYDASRERLRAEWPPVAGATGYLVQVVDVNALDPARPPLSPAVTVPPSASAGPIQHTFDTSGLAPTLPVNYRVQVKAVGDLHHIDSHWRTVRLLQNPVSDYQLQPGRGQVLQFNARPLDEGFGPITWRTENLPPFAVFSSGPDGSAALYCWPSFDAAGANYDSISVVARCAGSDSGVTFRLLVDAPAPLNLEPAEGTTWTDSAPQLRAVWPDSSDPGPNVVASQWQISDTAGDYDEIWDSDLTIMSFRHLAWNTTFYWRVRFQLANGVTTPWSAETAFTTAPPSLRVTTTADSGPGSLRQALLDAARSPSPGHIIFNLPDNSQIMLESSLPQITTDMIIHGPANGLTINGSSRSQIFTIQSAQLSASNLAVVSGVSSGTNKGGGILAVDADLILDHVTFAQNVADMGGALAIQGGSARLSNCSFLYNAANELGGAIYCSEEAQVRGSQLAFSGNSANTSAMTDTDNDCYYGPIDLGIKEVTLLQSPSSQLSIDQNAVTLRATILSAGQPYMAQWRKDDQPLGGATTASYTIPSSTESDSGQYTLTVSDGTGASITSAPAVLRVIPHQAGGQMLFVTTTADSGPGSLRQIIQHANDIAANMSNFYVWVHFATELPNAITLHSPLPPVEVNLVLFGPGPQLFIEGGGQVRPFTIQHGNVYIGHLHITGGLAQGGDQEGSTARGGAVMVSPGEGTRLTLDHVTFSGNRAVGGPGGDGLGGALFVDNGGTVLLQDSTFEQNAAQGGPEGKDSAAGKGLGGAIYNLGLIGGQNTSFADNTASDAGQTRANNKDIYGHIR